MLLAVAMALAGLLILLAVPVELTFKIGHTKKTDGQVNVRWLFGLVRFYIDIPGTAKPKKPKKKITRYQSKPVKEPRPHRGKSGSKNILSLLKQPIFRRRLYRFLRELLRATHSHDLDFRLRIGLGDPADTGRLWAFLGPVAAMTANIHSATISITPEFTDQVFEINSQGNFRLIPLQFIVLTTEFVLSPHILRTWRLVYRSNR